MTSSRLKKKNIPLLISQHFSFVYTFPDSLENKEHSQEIRNPHPCNTQLQIWKLRIPHKHNIAYKRESSKDKQTRPRRKKNRDREKTTKETIECEISKKWS